MERIVEDRCNGIYTAWLYRYGHHVVRQSSEIRQCGSHPLGICCCPLLHVKKSQPNCNDLCFLARAEWGGESLKGLLELRADGHTALDAFSHVTYYMQDDFLIGSRCVYETSAHVERPMRKDVSKCMRVALGKAKAWEEADVLRTVNRKV